MYLYLTASVKGRFARKQASKRASELAKKKKTPPVRFRTLCLLIFPFVSREIYEALRARCDSVKGRKRSYLFIRPLRYFHFD